MKQHRAAQAEPTPAEQQPAEVAAHDNGLARDELARFSAEPGDRGLLQSLIDTLGTESGSGEEQATGAEDEFAMGFVAPELPPGFANTLGQTTAGIDFVAPELVITVEQRDGGDWYELWNPSAWVATIAPTTSRDATHHAVAAPAGVHPAGQDTLNGTTFDLFLAIDEAAHGRIVSGEQEHLDDMQLAYELTLKAIADVIDSLSDSEFFAASEGEARARALAEVNARLHPKLQVSSPEVASMVWTTKCLQLITGEHTRDESGWHTAGTHTEMDGIDLPNKRITQTPDFGGTQVGVHPSSEIVSLDDLP